MSNLINEWLIAKETLDSAQDIERKLRLQITSLILENKLEGSKTTVLEGYKLAATAVLNYTFDEKAFSSYAPSLLTRDLDTIEYRPKLIIPAYRKLPADSLMHRCVTVKPGMSQLRVVE